MINIDEKDRMILKILQVDSNTTNAAVGEKVGLSGPSVHERLKRMRVNGVVIGTQLQVDPSLVGKGFLSFVLLKTKGFGKEQQVKELAKIPEIEEIHSVAGQFSLLLKVRTASPSKMEELYETIYSISGIESSETIIAFKSFIERPVYISSD